MRNRTVEATTRSRRQSALEELATELERKEPDVSAAERIEQADQGLRSEEEEAAEALAEAEASMARTRAPEPAELRKLEARRSSLEQVRDTAREVSVEKGREQAGERDAAASRTEADHAHRAVTTAAAASARAADAARARQALAEEAEAKADQARAALRDHETGPTRRLEELRGQLPGARRDSEERTRQSAEAAAGLKELEKRLADAQTQALEAGERDLAAAVAHGHEPGDRCPVCDRELETDWRAPEAPDLTTVREQKHRIETESEAGRRKAERAALAAERAKNECARIEEAIGESEREATASRARLDDLLGVDPWATDEERRVVVDKLRRQAVGTREAAVAAAEDDKAASAAEAATRAQEEGRLLGAEQDRNRLEELKTSRRRAEGRLKAALETLRKTTNSDEQDDLRERIRENEAGSEVAEQEVEKLIADATKKIETARRALADHQANVEKAMECRRKSDRIARRRHQEVGEPTNRALDLAREAREIALAGAAAEGPARCRR